MYIFSLKPDLRDYSDQSRALFSPRFVRASAFTPNQKMLGRRRNTRAIDHLLITTPYYLILDPHWLLVTDQVNSLAIGHRSSQACNLTAA